MPKTVETKVSWEDLEVAEEQPQAPAYFPGLGDDAAEMHQLIRDEMERRGVPHCESEYEYQEIKPGQTPTRAPEQIPEIIIDWQEDTMRIYREQLYQAFRLTPEELDSSNSIDAERLLKIAQDAEAINATLDSERLGVECMDAYREGLIQNTTLNDFRGLRAAIRDLANSVTVSFDTFFKACSLLFEVRVLCVWDEFIWKREGRKRTRWLHDLESGRITEVEYQDLCAREQAKISNQQEYPPGTLDLGTLTTEEEMERFRVQWDIRRSNGTLALCTPSRFGLTGR